MEYFSEGSTERLLSSDTLGWKELRLEQQRFAPNEMSRPPQPEHFLCLNLEAECDFWQQRDGETRRRGNQVGETILMPAGQESRWRSETATTTLHLWIEPALIERAAAQMGINSAGLRNSFGSDDTRLLHLGLALRDEVQSGGGGGTLFAESLSMAVAVHLLTHYGSWTVKPAQAPGLSAEDVRRVKDHVRENLGGGLSLAEVAAVVHVSPFHFARLWRRATGTSLHQSVIAARLEAATALLKRETLSVGQIAAAVGFAQQSHLAAHFRRMTGVSPAEYRRQAR